MKNKILLLIFWCFTSLGVYAQGTATFKVADMPFFPDTAYEGQTYSFNIYLQNSSNQTVNSTVYIMLSVDSITTIIDSIPQAFFLPNDTLTRVITNYNFTQPLYKAGNNIVVVWPVVNNSPAFPVDTFTTDVFFVPLNSIEDPGNKGLITIYPIPANETIYIDAGDEFAIEYVRIYSSDGKLADEHRLPGSGWIPVRHLPPGMYILEAISSNKMARSRFIRK